MQTQARPCEVCGAHDFRSIGQKEAHSFVACEACGLERIDPAPTDEVLAKVYGAHYYDAWGLARNEAAVAEMKKGTFLRIVDGLAIDGKGKRALDCGAATGFMMAVLEQRGFEPYGVELSEYGANKIKERFGKDRAFQGQLEDATFPTLGETRFDVITMCDFIEHVRDPKRTLQRAHDLLAQGGTIAITTPRIGSLTHKLMGMSWIHYKVEHLYYFSSENMDALLGSVGFSEIQTQPLWKTMDLDYISHQVSVYGSAVGKTVHKAASKLPMALKHARFPTLMGELVAYAKKR